MSFIFSKNPLYNENTQLNDIAILKLSSEVQLNQNIQLACLPDITQVGFPTQVGASVYAVGWGKFEINSICFLNDILARYS